MKETIFDEGENKKRIGEKLSIGEYRDFKGTSKVKKIPHPNNPFVPLEEIVDENSAEKINNFEKKDLTPGLSEKKTKLEENNEEYREEEAEKMEELRRKLKAQTINFEQGEGAVHVGTDVGDLPESIKENEREETLDKEKNKSRGDKKLGIFLPNFISKFRRLVTILPNDAVSYRKALRNPGEGHDNLKTLKKIQPKMERAKRREARDFLHNEQKEPPTWEDILEDQKN